MSENDLKTGLEDKQDFVQVMKDSKYEYALATFDRAFPYFADGLKPVHKRAIYTMYQENLTYFKKLAYTIGLTMGKYHPYADTAIYGALVLMGQPFTTNYPYIDTQGNFGSEEGDPAAAPRYIECKMSKFTIDMITSEIDNYSIEYINNYDWTTKEPVYLPSKMPLLLIQGSSGMGEAFVNYVPPHNLNDVGELCLKYIANKNISNKELVKGFYPDFPTGGIITNKDEIAKFYAMEPDELDKLQDEKAGSVLIKYKADMFIDRNNNSIVIKELPFGVTFDKIKDKIVTERKNKNNVIWNNIINFGNLKQKNGNIWYEIICKKDSNLLEIYNLLLSKTQLEKTAQFVLIVNFGKSVKRLSIKGVIEEWYKIRYDTKRRKFIYEHSVLKNKLHILEGLLIVYFNKQEIIDLVSNSEDKTDLINNLVKKYKMSMIQAKSISEMPIHTLTKLSKQKLEEEIADKRNRIEELNDSLRHIDKLICDDIKEMMRKYGHPRRTKFATSKEQTEESKISYGCVLSSNNAIGIFDSDKLTKGKDIIKDLPKFIENGKSIKELTNIRPIKKELKGIISFYDTIVKRENLSVIGSNIYYKTDNKLDSFELIYDEDDYIAVVSEDKNIKKFKVGDITSKSGVKCNKILSSAYIEKDTDGILYYTPSGKYHYLLVSDIPEYDRVAQGNLINFDEKDIYLCAIKKNDSIAIFLYDEHNYYVTAINMMNLKISNRVNKPNILINSSSLKVSGISTFTHSRDTVLALIGSKGIIHVNGRQLRLDASPKKLSLKVIGSYQLI